MNPYRVYGDLMKILDPKSSFVTGDSGNTRDQISTVTKLRFRMAIWAGVTSPRWASAWRRRWGRNWPILIGSASISPVMRACPI